MTGSPTTLALLDIILPPVISSNLKKAIKLIMNDPKTVPHPMILTKLFDKYFLPNPLIKNPMNGKSGIRKIKVFMFKVISYQLSDFSSWLNTEGWWLINVLTCLKSSHLLNAYCGITLQ